MSTEPRKNISEMTPDELRARFDEAACRLGVLEEKHKILFAEVEKLRDDIIKFGRLLTPIDPFRFPIINTQEVA